MLGGYRDTQTAGCASSKSCRTACKQAVAHDDVCAAYVLVAQAQTGSRIGNVVFARMRAHGVPPWHVRKKLKKRHKTLRVILSRR